MKTDNLFYYWCLVCVIGLVLSFLTVISFIIGHGLPTINRTLFVGDTDFISGILGLAPIWDGIWPACVGTLMVVISALLLALFPGLASGIWLAQAKPSRFKQIVSLVIDIVAGIPSILMGLFGFSLILLLRHWLLPSANVCLLLSALSLAILIIPYLAASVKTALLALPASLLLTALSLGMSYRQALINVLIPQASRGIMSGIMLATGRAAEDTAVIMLTGVVVNAGMPVSVFERYEALPFTIFYYSAQYQNETELQLAFGAALVLLCITAALFTLASLLQSRYQGTSRESV